VADSAEYKVLLALRSQLEAITVANGFNVDVQAVQLYDKFHDEIPVHPSIMIGTIDSSEDQRTWSDYNAITLRVLMSLSIETYADEHKEVGEFVADVKKKLFAEIPMFLGGLSRWLRVDTVDRIHTDEDSGRAGALMVLTIYFRHPIQDPYTLIP